MKPRKPGRAPQREHLRPGLAAGPHPRPRPRRALRRPLPPRRPARHIPSPHDHRPAPGSLAAGRCGSRGRAARDPGTGHRRDDLRLPRQRRRPANPHARPSPGRPPRPAAARLLAALSNTRLSVPPVSADVFEAARRPPLADAWADAAPARLPQMLQASVAAGLIGRMRSDGESGQSPLTARPPGDRRMCVQRWANVAGAAVITACTVVSILTLTAPALPYARLPQCPRPASDRGRGASRAALGPGRVAGLRPGGPGGMSAKPHSSAQRGG
jgi:hypothetical protein